MLTSILTAAGYKVGLYTSPSLHTVTERIRVGLEPIGREEFASLVDRVWSTVESVGEDGGFGRVSYFELFTLLAFQHFHEISADFQVIEVGLGGRLDATNVVEPEISIITSISLDHVAILGDTIGQIAAEKAGIIKPSRPVVVAPQSEEAIGVIRAHASGHNAPIIDVSGETSSRVLATNNQGQSIVVDGLRDQYNVQLPLLGDHQLENAATAIAAAETLISNGFRLTKDDIVEGLQNVRWPGRLQVLQESNPVVVVDGAHNPHSMARLVESVQKYFDPSRIAVVFGAIGGHSLSGMAEELRALDPTIVATRSRHPKSAKVEDIATAALGTSMSVEVEYEGVGAATRKAAALVGDDGLVLGTGSISVVAEVIEEIQGIEPELYPMLKGPREIDARLA